MFFVGLSNTMPPDKEVLHVSGRKWPAKGFQKEYMKEIEGKVIVSLYDPGKKYLIKESVARHVSSGHCGHSEKHGRGSDTSLSLNRFCIYTYMFLHIYICIYDIYVYAHTHTNTCTGFQQTSLEKFQWFFNDISRQKSQISMIILNVAKWKTHDHMLRTVSSHILWPLLGVFKKICKVFLLDLMNNISVNNVYVKYIFIYICS